MCCTGAKEITISAMVAKTIAQIKSLINALSFFFLIGMCIPHDLLYCVKAGDEYAGACDNN